MPSEGARSPALLYLSLSSYAASRAVAFLLPVLLSNLLSQTDYGGFEYALALATIGAMVLGAGLPGVAPYFILKRETPLYRDFIARVLCVYGALCVASAGLAVLWGSNEPTILALLFTCAMLVQNLRSALFKVEGQAHLASVMDSALLIWLFCCCLVWWGLSAPVNLGTLAGMAGALVAVIGIYFLAAGAITHTPSLDLVRASVNMGIPLMACSAVLTLFVLLPRIYMGGTGAEDMAGVYAFQFRIASLGIVAFQFAQTYWFRDFYAMTGSRLDVALAQLLSGFFLLGLVIVAVSPWLLPSLSRLFSTFGNEEQRIMLWMSAQSALWFCSAQAELINHRDQRGIALLIGAVATTAVLTGSLFAIGAITGVAQLVDVSRLQYGCFAVLVAYQLSLLARGNGSMWRSTLVLVAASLLTLGVDQIWLAR